MALVISILALALSAFVFVHNRRADKRKLLLQAHDQLLDADRQDGRRILFEMQEKGRSPSELSPDEYRSVNHALASFNTLGFLCRKRYVARSDAVDLWGLTTVRAYRAAEAVGFLTLRDAQNMTPVWPNLRYFVAWIEATGGGELTSSVRPYPTTPRAGGRVHGSEPLAGEDEGED